MKWFGVLVASVTAGFVTAVLVAARAEQSARTSYGTSNSTVAYARWN